MAAAQGLALGLSRHAGLMPTPTNRQQSVASASDRLRRRNRLAGPSLTPSTGVRCSAAATAGAAAPKAYLTSSGLVDFYEVLGVDDDASYDDIKLSYRRLAKQCHPDYLGGDGHDMCVLLNEAYEVLSDPTMRQRYDAQLEAALAAEALADDYTGQPLSKWLVGHRMGKNEDPNESRAVFVDECACIGCKMCVWCASGTFRVENSYGRSRVFAQWVDTEEHIQTAIDSCPVNCIHWVNREELPALEYVMQKRMTPTNVGIMMGGAGRNDDVFAETARFMRERQQRAEAAAAARRYTPVQEEARRQAAEKLAREQMGWFANFANMFMPSGSNSKAEGDEQRVGSRRRARRQQQPAGELVGGGQLVPVPVGPEQRWQRG